jgi:Autoinducer binding domain
MLPWEFSERILRVASLSDLERDAAQYSRLLGFEHHAYVLKMPVPVCDQDAGDYQLHNLNGEAWQALYGGWNDEERQSTDVRVRHVRAGLPATSWSVDAGVSHTHNDIARSAQGILRTAHTVGLRGGVTVPIFSPGASWGLMTFSTQNTSNLRDLAPLVAPALCFLSQCQCASAAWHSDSCAAFERTRARNSALGCRGQIVLGYLAHLVAQRSHRELSPATRCQKIECAWAPGRVCASTGTGFDRFVRGRRNRLGEGSGSDCGARNSERTA